MNKIIMALPKGRILKELIPLLKKAILFLRKSFLTLILGNFYSLPIKKNLSIIKVRSFDVATFVAFGAAQIGVAGDDVINEFNYDEIYNFYDLKIGKCRLSVAKIKEKKISDKKDILLLLQSIKILQQIILQKKVSELNV